MANPQLYTNASVSIDGKSLVQHASVKITQKSNATPVKTVGGGWSGVSPGAPETQIDVTSAVPAAGFEYEPSGKMNGTVPVTVTVFAAGKIFKSKGFILDHNFQHAVNAEATSEMMFQGGPGKWE